MIAMSGIRLSDKIMRKAKLPGFPARKLGAFGQRFQLRPLYRRVNAAVERPLREVAVSAGDDVLAPDDLGQPHDARGYSSGYMTTLVAWLMTPAISS